MSRFQIVLLATAFPLIAAGSYCLSWQDLRLLSPVISSNGRIFGVVDGNGQVRGREIREWSADLAVQRTIRPDDGLRITCSASGDVLAVQHYHLRAGPPAFPGCGRLSFEFPFAL